MNIRKLTGISVIAIALLCSPSVLAQTAAPAGWPPPKVLQIYREEIKPGKGPAHEVVEAGWPRAFTKANWPTHYLAAVAITGPSEAWFMAPYDSFAAWETENRNVAKTPALKKELDQLEAKDGELRSGGRSLVASFREDLSNEPNVDMPKMRYLRILTFRIRPGHEAQFADAAKIVQAGHGKAKLPAHWATYQVSSGMPGPTFLVFVPTKSLEEVDFALAHARELQEAEGEENVKKLQTIAADAYLSVESNIFEFNAKMSYASKEWIAEDPEFWKPKAMAPAKPEAKKQSAETKPTAKTEKK